MQNLTAPGLRARTKTMDTINEAFEKLLDDLYQNAAFEASADARVLKTVLAQDGYMKSDFEKQEE